jgi:hypothetical protein
VPPRVSRQRETIDPTNGVELVLEVPEQTPLGDSTLEEAGRKQLVVVPRVVEIGVPRPVSLSHHFGNSRRT